MRINRARLAESMEVLGKIGETARGAAATFWCGG